jgi:hypothetical protein
MKLLEFTDFIKEIYKYYRYKTPPTADEIEDWLLAVDYIPSEALPWILQNLKDTKDNLPRNLPRALNFQWNDYRNEHPEKFTKAEEEANFNCPDCHGGGVLHCKTVDPENKLKYTYVAICASCSASREKFGSVLREGGKISLKTDSGAFIPSGAYVPPVLSLTKQQIIDKGWEFLQPENTYAKRLDKIPDDLSYAKLKTYQRLIRETHHNDLARQAEGLIGEGFTKHEATRAVDQAVEFRAKQARGSDNPGDIIKEIFDI